MQIDGGESSQHFLCGIGGVREMESERERGRIWGRSSAGIVPPDLDESPLLLKPSFFGLLLFMSSRWRLLCFAPPLPPSTSSSLVVFLSFTVMIPPLPSQLCSFTSPVFCKGNPSIWRTLNAQKHLDNIIIMMSHHLSVSLYIYCLTFLIVAFFCEYCFFKKLSIIREIFPNVFLFWLHLPFLVL